MCRAGCRSSQLFEDFCHRHDRLCAIMRSSDSAVEVIMVGDKIPALPKCQTRTCHVETSAPEHHHRLTASLQTKANSCAKQLMLCQIVDELRLVGALRQGRAAKMQKLSKTCRLGWGGVEPGRTPTGQCARSIAWRLCVRCIYCVVAASLSKLLRSEGLGKRLQASDEPMAEQNM